MTSEYAGYAPSLVEGFGKLVFQQFVTRVDGQAGGETLSPQVTPDMQKCRQIEGQGFPCSGTGRYDSCL